MSSSPRGPGAVVRSLPDCPSALSEAGSSSRQFLNARNSFAVYALQYLPIVAMTCSSCCHLLVVVGGGAHPITQRLRSHVGPDLLDIGEAFRLQALLANGPPAGWQFAFDGPNRVLL